MPDLSLSNIDGLYLERLKTTSSSTITTLESENVPANRIRKINVLAVYNGDDSARDVDVSILGHGYDHIVKHLNSVASGEWVTEDCKFYLKENEKIKITYNSVGSSKTLEVHITGIEFKLME